MVCALLITALCIAIGLVFHLQHEIDLLQGKCAKLSQDSMLHEVLDLLKGYKLIKMKCWEMNMKQGKKIKKMNVDPIVETSPEPATGTDGRPHGEPPNGTDRLRGMQDTNAVLQIRYERLRLSMAQLRLSRMRTWCTRYQLQNQMDELAHLFYDIWNGWVRRRTFEGIHAFAMSRRGEKHLPQLHSSTHMVALYCLHVALRSIAFSPAVRCYSLQCVHKGMIVRRFVTEQNKNNPNHGEFHFSCRSFCSIPYKPPMWLHCLGEKGCQWCMRPHCIWHLNLNCAHHTDGTTTFCICDCADFLVKFRLTMTIVVLTSVILMFDVSAWVQIVSEIETMVLRLSNKRPNSWGGSRDRLNRSHSLVHRERALQNNGSQQSCMDPRCAWESAVQKCM